ncbi:unnamed protein product [Arctogadus glacialis]
MSQQCFELTLNMLLGMLMPERLLLSHSFTHKTRQNDGGKGTEWRATINPRNARMGNLYPEITNGPENIDHVLYVLQMHTHTHTHTQKTIYLYRHTQQQQHTHTHTHTNWTIP